MQRGIERLSRPQNTEGDMHELSHHGADDDFRGFSVCSKTGFERTPSFRSADGDLTGM